MTRRYAELDYIKVIGIFAVILIHSLRPVWNPNASAAEIFLNQELRFAVPGFLFCSGFLYAHTRAFDWRATLARLRRILIPYLVASLAAEIYHAMRGHPRSLSENLSDILLGSAFGPYYYIFIIVVLVIATPIFAGISERSIIALMLFFFAAQIYLNLSAAFSGDSVPQPHSPFWWLRSPGLWWNYFLLGWIARHRYENLSRWVIRHRPQIASTLVILCAGFATAQLTPLPLIVVKLSSWLQIFAIVMLIATLSCGVQKISAPVRRISDATYAVYLFHLFFLLPVQAHFRGPPSVLEPTAVLAPLIAGICGPFALIALVRLFLGRRSRLIMGA